MERAAQLLLARAGPEEPRGDDLALAQLLAGAVYDLREIREMLAVDLKR